MTNDRTDEPPSFDHDLADSPLTSAFGPTVRIWMVPHRSNPHFVGRERELAELSAWFTPGEFKALVCLGGAGVGKTQLAVEYAYRRESEYDAVFWVSAETLVTLRADLATLATARALDLSHVSDPSEAAQIAAVVDWLRENGRWLLICDNAGTVAAEGLMELLQVVPHGHVLFTSRRVDWPIALADLTLERFSDDVAVEFLRRRTQAIHAGADDRAAALSRELDGSPLLLEQAGGYLETRRAGYDAYLARLRAADPIESIFDDVADYREPLPATWALSEAELEPAARAILRIASFFARAPLPRELFERRPELIAEAAALLSPGAAATPEPNAATAGLEQLASYSLIELTLSAVSWRQSLHPARAAIPPAERGEWLAFAVCLFDVAVVREPAQLELLQAHAFALLEATDELGLQPLASGLYAELGALLAAKGRHHEAEPLLRSAVVLREQAHPADDPELAHHLQRLADVLIAMSRTEEAEPLRHRARRQQLSEVLGHA